MKTLIEIRPGDIFLIDSKKTGPKIVKFFMTAPTVFHHLWRKIRGTQEVVLYYHVGMFIKQDTIAEQQSKVLIRTSEKVLNTSDRLFIARRKDLKPFQQRYLTEGAIADVGAGYDIVNCIGKFITWLTGIKWFARYMETKKEEICVNRGAKWYKNGIGEKFGVKTHSELTTHMMYKYIKNSDNWAVIYEGIPNAS